MSEYVILLCNPNYPNYLVAYGMGMAETIDRAIRAKQELTGPMVDNGHNYVVIKRKLY